MAETKELRLGRKDASGAIVAWPEKSISGFDYQRPCTTQGIGGGYFVVVDIFPKASFMAEIEKLRESVKGMGAPPKKVKVKDEQS